MLRVLITAAGLLANEPGYIAPETCKPCHAAIWESYRQTGMGRSFTPASAASEIEDWGVGFLHPLSSQAFDFIATGGTRAMRRAAAGLPPVTRTIDFIMGSGNHSRTYLHRDQAGKLFELPLGWYAADGGHWAMSPGYDRADHSGFRRQVPDSCLFCHNGYPSQANGGLAHGIDCQRCHGPGAEHAARRGSIVNPAKLTAERSLEVCLQCHLESASRTIPDSIRRYDRGPYSFRPGEALGDFTLYFDRAADAGDDAFTVNHSAYGMMGSRCYQKSAGKLTCTTCHDPHVARRGPSADSHYTKACQGCHAAAHPDRQAGCAGCHMPLRRTDDAVHVLMTDHRIRKTPPAGLLNPKKEQHGRYTGPVRPLYPPRRDDTAKNALYLAVARLNDKARLAEAAAELAKQLRQVRPREAGFHLQLAVAQRELKRPGDAANSYREALAIEPGNNVARLGLAELLVETGRPEAAIRLIPAGTADADLLNVLAIAYTAQSRFAEAEAALRRAIEANAESSLTWLNLGVALEAQNKTGAAAEAYRRALTIQPDLSRARQFLRRVAP